LSPEKHTSRLRRFLGFIAFRLIPLLLVIGILWSGYHVVQAVVRQRNEQSAVESRLPSYRETASAIAPTLALNSEEARSGKLSVLYSRGQELYQDFVTNTPQPTADMSGVVLPPVNTVEPTKAPTAAVIATETPVPTEMPAVSSTPRPLPTLMMPGNVDPQIAAATAIPTQVPTVNRNGQDILNILLLGNDGEITNDGFIRTDTMIIVSINRTAGTVAMLSLPRDLYVFMPGWSMNRLNVAYIHGETSGWTDGGFGLLRETIFYNFGINVHYFAMVDLSGFKEIVDTLGGIDVTVDCAIQDYPLMESEVPEGAVQASDDGLVTLPVGYYHLNGGAALWYARSRGNSSDFDRGRRQQQVLRAIWRKALDTGQLANAPQLWTQGTQLVQTNLPFEEMVNLLPIALNLDTSKMEQFTLRRLYDTTPWQTPEGDYVQLPTYDHILELLTDMYTPPTTSQITSEGATIAVYNGTSNNSWDRVAAERLAWDGFNATASGTAATTDYVDTVLIDYTGDTKGGSLGDIAATLHVLPENIRREPDPNRTVDFEVYLGSNYSSCTYNVLEPVEEPTTAG
jgi:polyisoprenyl-teichoic acid--peptidoglycan teichoic acid transferase